VAIWKYIVSRCLRSFAFYIGVIFFTFFLLIIPMLSYNISFMCLVEVGDIFRNPFPHIMREQDIIKWGLVPHPDVAEFINMCWRHMMNCISGDFGHSFLTHEPVSIHLGERIANTSLLVGVSLFASLLLGSALVGREEDNELGKSSKISNIFSQITNSAPIYWVGMVVLFAGAYALPNHFGFGFPEFGTIYYETWTASLTTASGGIMIYIDVLFHLVLPMSVLTLCGTSIIYSTLKTNLSENLTIEKATTDFVKGVSSEYNFYSSLRKTLQVIKEWFPVFISTVVLVEVVYNWSGVGQWLFHSILLMDYPAIRGCIITLSLFVILADLIFDIAFNLLMNREKILNPLERCELRATNYERFFVEKCR